ncbi:hypothetical protein [Qingshengfaniella alkalisoli]|uniref:Uncharacterized protein n=1 Tax=Qingshengfaniella alkalisoli TaxID=2599296 RepID=A0A5B8I6U7_9RHOB|nr:hypothetical protein [Qingshengfaniella alkalisoli]QDY69325.1 hypothetical protein FPZ52_06565 [Qingshengfaniella alkalisoli]
MRFAEGPVKYFDFRGETASDIADSDNLLSYLRGAGIAQDHEHLAGFRVSYQGPYREGGFAVLVYLYTDDQLDADMKTLRNVRAVDVEMTANRFFQSFKRFDLLQVRNGLEVEECMIDGPHYD